MAKQDKSNTKSTVAIIVVIAVVAFIFAYSAGVQRHASIKKNCEENDKIFIESSASCREKTVSEKFNERCMTGVTIGDIHYSCSDLRKENLEFAFLNDKLIRHGSSLYESGTLPEVKAGKQTGDYCLSASDTWSHIGETRCVVFTPTYFAYSGNNYFLNEKKDYTNGFVVYMYGNYGWNWFLNTYKNNGAVLVCGKITTYRGHPEIKASPNSTLVSPNGVVDGSYTVYKYSCK